MQEVGDGNPGCDTLIVASIFLVYTAGRCDVVIYRTRRSARINQQMSTFYLPLRLMR